MESGVKIAAASSVLLAGVLLALMFRHDAAETATDLPGNRDRLVLGTRPQPPQLDRPVSEGYHGRAELPFSPSAAAGTAGRRATILTPKDRGQPPPALAKDYPGTSIPSLGHSDVPPNGRGRSGWGTSIELPPATGRVDPVRTHRIVDGDTLRALAERYLGSADRDLEIYEANRHALPSPKLLPIGVELKIPPSSGPASRLPLVPIPRRVGGED